MPSTSSLVIVDDDELICTAMVRILARQGFEVTAFTDPISVLEQVIPGDFALLVTDVVMAPITGVELARRLREEAPDLKVLFVSGHTRRALAQLGANAPGDTDVVLRKPLEPNQLIQHITQLLGTLGTAGTASTDS